MQARGVTTAKGKATVSKGKDQKAKPGQDALKTAQNLVKTPDSNPNQFLLTLNHSLSPKNNDLSSCGQLGEARRTDCLGIEGLSDTFVVLCEKLGLQAIVGL